MDKSAWPINRQPSIDITDTTTVTKTATVPGLGLAGLDAKLADVELAPAPPVRPAEEVVLLPAQFHYQQVPDLRVRGEQEGDGAVPLQGRAAGVGRVVM